MWWHTLYGWMLFHPIITVCSRCHSNENTEHMKLPELFRIKHQLDVIHDGGDVLERGTLEYKNKHKSVWLNCLLFENWTCILATGLNFFLSVCYQQDSINVLISKTAVNCLVILVFEGRGWSLINTQRTKEPSLHWYHDRQSQMRPSDW